MKMFELVTWFQKEYHLLVSKMKASNHHYDGNDQLNQFLNGEISGDSYNKSGCEPADLNPYHLESDVWTHTMMVCKQAENMPYEVQIAALLHDIGKPDVRKVNPKNNHVMFLNHDAVSAFKSIEILNRPELELSKEQKSLIFNLIALHTQVFKQTPDKLVQHCSDFKLLEYLLLLGKADHEGRFTNKTGDVISLDQIGGIGLLKRSRETTKEVVLLCGVPNSGKSTYVTKNPEYYVVSRDTLVEREFPDLSYNEAWTKVDQDKINKKLREQLENAKNFDQVIIDQTHMSKQSRARSLVGFGWEYKRKCVVFLTDMPTIFLRNSQRYGKVISKDVIEDMMTRFYPPTLQEFDEIEYVF